MIYNNKKNDNENNNKNNVNNNSDNNNVNNNKNMVYFEGALLENTAPHGVSPSLRKKIPSINTQVGSSPHT